MIPIRAILAALLTVALASPGALGQNQIVVMFGPNNDGSIELAEILDNIRSSAEFRLQSRLRDLQQICRLDGGQVAKLRVASKGAVEKMLDRETDSKTVLFDRYRQQAGIDVNAKADENGEKGNLAVRPAAAIPRTFSVVIPVDGVESIEEEAIWQNTLKKELDKEQYLKYITELAKREAAHRAAAIDCFMAKIDMMLMLTEEQWPQVRAVVDDEFGAALLKNLRINQQQRGIIRAQQGPVYARLVEHVLTPEQLAEWNRSIDPALQQLIVGR